MTMLVERQIHLWLAFCDDIKDTPLMDGYRALMSDTERARELKFQFAEDRKTFVLTRVLVRTVLSRYLDLEPTQWRFGTNQYGRPEIQNSAAMREGLNFNVAHSHGLIVLAVTAHRSIGVDVEHITQRRVSLDIARRYFAADEVAALAALPRSRQHSRFFEYWTLKESYIKARGMGLSIPLDQFAFLFPNDRAVELRIDPALADDSKRWQFWQFHATADYLVAVCAERRAVATSELLVRRVVPGRTEQPLCPQILRR
jgi:4'-phosphopantetheinyl transferase